MTEGGHNGAWYCSQTEERKICPAQGCPKGYCEREHGWLPGMPEPDHYARPQPPAPQDQPAPSQDDLVEAALMAFSGGLVRFEDGSNPRGFVMLYNPRLAMSAVIPIAQAPIIAERDACLQDNKTLSDCLLKSGIERDAALAKLAAAEATIHKLVNHIKDNRSRSYAFIAALATEKNDE